MNKTTVFVKCSLMNADMIYNRHFKFPVLNTGYSYDVNEDVGFFSAVSILGCTALCQVKGREITHATFTIKNKEYLLNDLNLHHNLKTKITQIYNKAKEEYYDRKRNKAY